MKISVRLVEGKLQSVWSHLTQPQTPVGIITAYMPTATPEQNRTNNDALVSTLRGAGYAFSWIDGVWVRAKGAPDEHHVSEVSAFVHGSPRVPDSGDKLQALLTALTQRYGQSAYLFKPRVEVADDIVVGMYNAQGQPVAQTTDLSIEALSRLFGRARADVYKNHTFMFES